MRNDRNGQIRFASLQGETALKYLPEEKISSLSTVIYLRGDKVLEKSAAILNVSIDMGFPWSLAGVFLVVPVFIRDFVYSLVANNRYRIMEKRDTCRLPTPEERDKILP